MEKQGSQRSVSNASGKSTQEIPSKMAPSPAYSEDPRCCVNANCHRSAAEGLTKCKRHAGFFNVKRQCSVPHCTKVDAGGGRCRKHGGGTRCQETGCEKASAGGGFCVAHGGGKRCQATGCDRCVQGASTFCKAHGGGRRCQHMGCKRSAQGRSSFCIRHGGGARCNVEGCSKLVRRRGFCQLHSQHLAQYVYPETTAPSLPNSKESPVGFFADTASSKNTKKRSRPASLMSQRNFEESRVKQKPPISSLTASFKSAKQETTPILHVPSTEPVHIGENPGGAGTQDVALPQPYSAPASENVYPSPNDIKSSKPICHIFQSAPASSESENLHTNHHKGPNSSMPSFNGFQHYHQSHYHLPGYQDLSFEMMRPLHSDYCGYVMQQHPQRCRLTGDPLMHMNGMVAPRMHMNGILPSNSSFHSSVGFNYPCFHDFRCFNQPNLFNAAMVPASSNVKTSNQATSSGCLPVMISSSSETERSSAASEQRLNGQSTSLLNPPNLEPRPLPVMINSSPETERLSVTPEPQENGHSASAPNLPRLDFSINRERIHETAALYPQHSPPKVADQRMTDASKIHLTLREDSSQQRKKADNILMGFHKAAETKSSFLMGVKDMEFHQSSPIERRSFAHGAKDPVASLIPYNADVSASASAKPLRSEPDPHSLSEAISKDAVFQVPTPSGFPGVLFPSSLEASAIGGSTLSEGLPTFHTATPTEGADTQPPTLAVNGAFATPEPFPVTRSIHPESLREMLPESAPKKDLAKKIEDEEKSALSKKCPDNPLMMLCGVTSLQTINDKQTTPLTIQLLVPGMMCMKNCGSAVKRLLQGIIGVQAVDIHFDSRTVTVQVQPNFEGVISSEYLSRALESIGFKAQCSSQLIEKIRKEEGNIQSDKPSGNVRKESVTGDDFDRVAQGCAMVLGGECTCGLDCICFGCEKHAKYQKLAHENIDIDGILADPNCPINLQHSNVTYPDKLRSEAVLGDVTLEPKSMQQQQPTANA